MDAEVAGWGWGPQVALAERFAEAVGGEGTTAGGHFFVAQMELMGFVNFVAALPRHVDGVLGSLSETKAEDHSATNPFQRGFDPFRPLLGEVLLTRAVDSYLTYVSELLSLVFRERPETLRSKEQVRVDFVLGFDSLEELREGIAERRVERLAYRGMAELVDWVRDTMGFTLVSERDQLRQIERLVEKRNLIVHHRGVIDYRYIRKCGSADGEIGGTLDLREAAADAFVILADSVWDADQRAAEKWGLERHPLPTDRHR